MKTLKTVSKLFLIAFAVVLSSCSGEDGGGGGGGSAAAGTIKAKVGGSNFKSMTMATTAMKVAVAGAYTITIQGSDANGKSINLIMHGVALQTGTYDIGGNNQIAIIGSYTELNINNPMASKTYTAPFEGGAVAGSISITEITDTKIVGTFNFTAKNQDDQSDVKEVKSGAFNVNFQNL